MSKLVLIIEDSEPCAETLQIALESLPGLETRVMQSVSAAIAALRDNGNDVAAIVTDLNFHDLAKKSTVEKRLSGKDLPRIILDGFDLIRQLRAESRFARLPILLISGDSDPRLPARALEQGANAFFAKPYSPSAVRRKLEQLLCSQG
jgi:two-component system chemotaxis response regulator CheY